jgi:hypothetical protein
MKIIITLLLSAGLSLAAPSIIGKWQLSSKDADGKPTVSQITFLEEAGSLKASLKADGKSVQVNRIRKEGEGVLLEITWEDDLIAVSLSPKGDSLAGEWKAGDDSGPITGTRLPEASLAGKWNLTATRPNGSTTRVDLDLTNNDGKWLAKLNTPEGQQVPVEQLQVSTDSLSFNIAMPQASIKVQLKREANTLKGTWTTPDQNSGPLEGTLSQK